MNHLRTLSTRGLLLVLAGVLALCGAGAALAVGVTRQGAAPEPKALDQAIHDALAAPRPEGVTARITFANTLLPTGLLQGQAGSALLSGASGRLWLRRDGTGRIELQSDAGDVQVVWSPQQVSVYDASSNTDYRLTPHSGTRPADIPTEGTPTLAEIDKTLAEIGARWALAQVVPTDVGGRPTYTVTSSPRQDGGLVAAVELAWDAANGTPLRAGIVATGKASPVLELSLRDVSFAPVAAADVEVPPPASARVVDLGSAAPGGQSRTVEGLAAVERVARFPVSVPETLGGLPRASIRLLGGDTVLVLYGRGLGTIALVERKADRPSAFGPLGALPEVQLGGVSPRELSTPLGTALEWRTGGVDFVLAGSVTPATAEDAARTLS